MRSVLAAEHDAGEPLAWLLRRAVNAGLQPSTGIHAEASERPQPSNSATGDDRLSGPAFFPFGPEDLRASESMIASTAFLLSEANPVPKDRKTQSRFRRFRLVPCARCGGHNFRQPPEAQN